MKSNTSNKHLSRRTFLESALAIGAAAAATTLTGCGTPHSLAEEKEKNKLDGGAFDIVIVGAGGAGMAAAIGAADQGAK